MSTGVQSEVFLGRLSHLMIRKLVRLEGYGMGAQEIKKAWDIRTFRDADRYRWIT